MGYNPPMPGREQLNVWKKAVIDLVAHSAGNRISLLDVKLAAKIDALL